MMSFTSKWGCAAAVADCGNFLRWRVSYVSVLTYLTYSHYLYLAEWST